MVELQNYATHTESWWWKFLEKWQLQFCDGSGIVLLIWTLWKQDVRKQNGL